MKKRNRRQPMTPHEKGLMIAAVVMVLVIFLLPSLLWAEDFAIINNRLNATWNEVWLIYDISGVVQDTAYKYNIDRWDTTFTGIAAGQHRATFYLLDSADLSDTLGYTISYPYQSGLTLTSADYDSIAAGISAAGSGTETIVLYANDTSKSTDVVVPYSRFTVKNTSGTKLLSDLNTLADGKFTVYLDTGSYVVETFAPGYYFPSYSLAVAGNSDSVEVAGYDTDSPEYTTIYGYIKALDGGAIYGARVEVKRSGDCAYATIDSSTTTLTTAIWNEPKVVFTDTSGYWSASIVKSTEYDDSACGYYYVEAKWDSRDVYKTGRLWVTGDAVDVSDSLAVNQGAN